MWSVPSCVTRVLLLCLLATQPLLAFWPFDSSDSQEQLPAYVMVHPEPTQSMLYGVGEGETFLDAKAKALNDIATQLRSEVRSVTAVEKGAQGTSASQKITLVTERRIENYEIVRHERVAGRYYLLLEYRLN